MIRYARSPNTTPESHISNFLHQHRADSRADKPTQHSTNLTNPVHDLSRPKSTTEAPVSQTELLVNLIHNTIQTVRDQFPALISAISSPGDSPKTDEKSKNLHSSNIHFMHERSANETLEENVSEFDEREPQSEGNGEDYSGQDEFEENNGHDFPKENAPIALIPPALIRTIVETSASSSVRGSAGASAGSVASTSASSSSSSSNGASRNTRQIESESLGSGSAEFLGAVVKHKVQALTSLLFAPIWDASAFIQRTVGYASSSGSGSSIPESSISPHPDHGHHGSRHGGRGGDYHHSHVGHTQHHNDNHHHSEVDNYHSGEREHHTEGHGNHLHENNLHTNQHSEKHDQESDQRHFHHQNTMKNESAQLIFEGYDPNLPHVVHLRDIRNNFKANVTDNFLPEETLASAGPVRVTFGKTGLEKNGGDHLNISVRKSREARMLLNERLGIYILEIFGSIAGLMWGAFHQITHLFQGRNDNQVN